MASNIVNLIVPAQFAGYVAEEAAKMNRIVKSGAAINNPVLAQMLAGGAGKFNLPYWKSLADTVTANVPSADRAVVATPALLSASKMEAVRIARNVAVAATDLEGMLIGEDPVAEAVRQFADMLDQTRQASLMSILSAVTGVDGGDAGTEADLAYDGVSAGVFSGTQLLKGIQAIWGDKARVSDVVLFMNSLTYSTIQVDQFTAGGLLDKAGTNVALETFLKAPVIIDDTVPVGKTYVVRKGGLSFASVAAAVPFETDRNPLAGNGGGETILTARDVYSYHVAGTSFTGSYAGDIVTDAELATIAKYTLAQSKKNCGVMVIAHA